MRTIIDHAPFIIVDNQKILPIERVPGLSPGTGCSGEWDEQPFGVVDRVTISLEAREKSRSQRAQTNAMPPALNTMADKAPTATHIPLTYSPVQEKK